MAEEQQQQEEHAEPTSGKKGLIRLIILVVAVVASSAGGFGAARMFKGGAPQPTRLEDDPADLVLPVRDDTMYEYIEFEAVTAPLDVPNVNRYIKLKICLMIPKELAKRLEVAKHIESKKRELKSWLTGYITGCTLEQVRGQENFNRIKHEIRAKFNEMLWPGQRPLITELLMDDFKVQ